jgi:diguanylate cyclase (GGDEF)-like protein/PAS domain S-box-containing protein
MNPFPYAPASLPAPDQLALQALNLSGVALLWFDSGGRLCGANPALLELTGHNLQTLSSACHELFHGSRFDQGLLASLLQDLAPDECWQGEVLASAADGSRFPVHLRLQALSGEQSGYIAIVEDLAPRRREQALIHRLRYFDALTGLPNWAWLVQELGQSFGLLDQDAPSLAIIRIDLNNFKAINDALGEALGDALIIALAARLSAARKANWLIARRDGDEFCVVVPASDAAQAMTSAHALLELVAQPILLQQQHYALSACAGISLSPMHGSDSKQLLDHAGTALHAAKRMAASDICLFSHDLAIEARMRRRIEHGLRHAIEQQEFFLCYQPKIDLSNNTLSGVEVLLRWRLPSGELLPPAEFIPIAEQTGQIVAIGRWVLQQACRQGQIWREAGYGDLAMAVNLSPGQFRQDDLAQMLRDILAQTGFPPSLLELEITESALMEDPVRAEALITDLHALGVTFSIDDFGTGYSSLAYLKRFSLQQLKIDRSFVAECFTDRKDRAIIASIINLAQHLGLQVVAEGVETQAQLNFLRALCCGQAQGYLFSPPLDAQQLVQWLEHQTTTAELGRL